MTIKLLLLRFFGVNYEDVTDAQRKFAKTVNYAVWFGNKGYYTTEEMRPYIKAALMLKGEQHESI